jgi:uncharacterized cupredoxin-like copper-binding protein
MKRHIILGGLLSTCLFAGAAQADAGHHRGDDHAAIGHPGKPGDASRTVQVDMTDTMRFTPARIDVRRGETIRFVIKNSGALRHEFVLGTMQELKQHAELMRRFPEMEHDDPNLLQVGPGQTGELLWKFDKTGTVDFACLQPGHFEAGMAGKVAVK